MRLFRLLWTLTGGGSTKTLTGEIGWRGGDIGLTGFRGTFNIGTGTILIG